MYEVRTLTSWYVFRYVGNICPFLPSFAPLLCAELRENVIDRISKKAHTFPLCSRDHEITLISPD